ncbi:hypothetical protein NG799_22660 [Laspinema sp. D1]|uniref:Uncharacterized protein n=1 Tax=Laspinema palackyanum D2a TaxID=2953684 RepID=A0ABT2MYR1_9CYAN|nr:hypothetical protein [Laspinema sp. D2b]MCT7969120.1 hypothetical protein [Laspinema sp. D2a]
MVSPESGRSQSNSERLTLEQLPYSLGISQIVDVKWVKCCSRTIPQSRDCSFESCLRLEDLGDRSLIPIINLSGKGARD